jgi:hypothetical protein
MYEHHQQARRGWQVKWLFCSQCVNSHVHHGTSTSVVTHTNHALSSLDALGLSRHWLGLTPLLLVYAWVDACRI